MAGTYRFSFGPWNIHSGADPFGPVVREDFTFAEKLDYYKELGFDIVPVKVVDKLYFNGVVLLVAIGIMDKDITGDKVADFILCCPDVG